METRDLNPEAEKPEVAATPATPAEALESQSVAAEAATDETLAQAAAEDRAEMNLEAVETQLDEKNLEAEKAVEAVEDEPQPVSADTNAAPLDESKVAAADEKAAEAAPAANLSTKDDVMARLTRLATDEAIEISRDEIAHLKQRFYAIRKLEQEAEMAAHIAEGNDPSTFIPALDPTEEEFKNLMNTVRERKAAIAAAEEEERKANLARKQALIDELRKISEDTDNVNRAFPRVKEIQAEFKTIGEVPPTDATTLWQSYQDAVEQFYDQLKVNQELRDYDFRKNLELKTLLCEEAEKLNDEEDIVLAFKRLQNLHDRHT